MKKTWIFVLVCSLLIITAIGVGGKMYMDKRTEEKEAEKIEIERKSIKALKERYANIKSVEIKDSGFDKKTGAFDVTVKMTNKENDSVTFTFPFWIKEESLGAILKVDKSVQIKGATTDRIHVIYSNNEEGEI